MLFSHKFDGEVWHVTEAFVLIVLNEVGRGVLEEVLSLVDLLAID